MILDSSFDTMAERKKVLSTQERISLINNVFKYQDFWQSYFVEVDYLFHNLSIKFN